MDILRSGSPEPQQSEPARQSVIPPNEFYGTKSNRREFKYPPPIPPRFSPVSSASQFPNNSAVPTSPAAKTSTTAQKLKQPAKIAKPDSFQSSTKLAILSKHKKHGGRTERRQGPQQCESKPAAAHHGQFQSSQAGESRSSLWSLSLPESSSLNIRINMSDMHEQKAAASHPPSKTEQPWGRRERYCT